MLLCADEKERLQYMKSVWATIGDNHKIDSNNSYKDVIDIYCEGNIVGECPISQDQYNGTCSLSFGTLCMASYLKVHQH